MYGPIYVDAHWPLVTEGQMQIRCTLAPGNGGPDAD